MWMTNGPSGAFTRRVASQPCEGPDLNPTVFLVLAFIFLFSLMYAVWPVPPSH
jgi:hypothetical protein